MDPRVPGARVGSVKDCHVLCLSRNGCRALPARVPLGLPALGEASDVIIFFIMV
jgi:hypothetical protein